MRYLECTPGIPARGKVIVVFSKENCAPCTMQLKSLSVALVDFQVAKLELLGVEFFKMHNVRQTPTTIVFNDGIEQLRLTGFKSPNAILNLLRPTP